MMIIAIINVIFKVNKTKENNWNNHTLEMKLENGLYRKAKEKTKKKQYYNGAKQIVCI